ncbi:MAG: histidine kinase, partial [Bacteroidota bacterium]
GNIWFGTMNGLVRYQGDGADSYLAPPATYLEAVSLFYTPVESKDKAQEGDMPVFKARDNHIKFRFRTVDLTNPDRIRYRYQLRGEDAGWSPLTAETAVRYAGISPGRYRFIAQATTDGGNTWGETAEYAFSIEYPLIKKPWFLGLLTLLCVGLLIGGFYGVYHRLQQQEAKKRRALEAKNQLLELEQKALQLQMNPHFIFNALNGIRGLVDGQHDAEARQQISRFAGLMRGILNNSRQESIPLADEIKTLDDYLKMEQFCQPFSFTYSIHPPENGDPEEINLPPMLLQPFVENAVLHGLSGKETGGHVAIHFFVRGRRMQCTVKDNGIGRKAAAERRQQRSPGHKSVALSVTKARLQAMKGRVDIKDVPQGGTEVELVVPIETW